MAVEHLTDLIGISVLAYDRQLDHMTLGLAYHHTEVLVHQPEPPQVLDCRLGIGVVGEDRSARGHPRPRRTRAGALQEPEENTVFHPHRR